MSGFEGRRVSYDRAARRTVIDEDRSEAAKETKEEERFNNMALLLVDSPEFRAEVLTKIGDWMKDDADRKSGLRFLQSLPKKIVKALPSDISPLRFARQCYESMLLDAEKWLRSLNEEYLMSSALEHKWSACSAAMLVDQCRVRGIAADSREEQIKGVCLDEREEILENMASSCFKKFSLRVCQKELKKRSVSVKLIAATLTNREDKEKYPHSAVLPSLSYLEELHTNDFEAQKVEMTRLAKQPSTSIEGLNKKTCVGVFFKIQSESGRNLFFRSVAFARLHDWKVAELTVKSTPKKSERTPTKKVLHEWTKLEGFSEASVHRSLGNLFSPVTCPS